MTPINNSDTAWLIVSDWMQDNDKYYDNLREDVLNPETNHYIWEMLTQGVGGIGCMVGGEGRIGGSSYFRYGRSAVCDNGAPLISGFHFHGGVGSNAYNAVGNF